MKKLLKSTITKYLRRLTKIKVAKSHETVIGITGSAGKTSAKAATVKILESQFKVDQSTKNYNTDFGMMLSILKQQAGGKSPLRWAKSIIGATGHTFLNRKKYDKLVLEMGVDKPGDMVDMLNIITPHIGIITTIAPVHLAEGQFHNVQEIFQEKSILVRSIKKGFAVLNRDNNHLKTLAKEKLNAQTVWFGILKKNTKPENLPPGIYARKIKTKKTGLTAEIISNLPDSFRINPSPDASSTKTITTHKLTCPILGNHQIYVLLPAIATGLLNNIPLKKCCTALKKFQLPPGRMNLIPAIKRASIIDSSYNASPKSMRAALKVLWDYPSQRKIAVLGSMNELGEYSKNAHAEIGRLVPEFAQMLITVGEEARTIAHFAANHGMPQHLIRSFKTAEEAGEHLKPILRHDDVVLVKGSQNNVRLENCIKLIMKNPKTAKKILVRQ